jgi:hypothetical protein
LEANALALAEKDSIKIECENTVCRVFVPVTNKNTENSTEVPILREVAPADNSLSKASALKVNTALRKYAALHL